MKDILKAIFPQLNDESLLAEISENAVLKDFSRGDVIVDQGTHIVITSYSIHYTKLYDLPEGFHHLTEGILLSKYLSYL